MSIVRRINKLNQLLARELGSNASNVPKYAWQHSDSWIRQMRVVDVVDDSKYEPRYEHIQNPESGLFYAIPVYVNRKVCENLHDQYVMSVWMDGMNFHAWRQAYGDNLEWPKGGEYFPVTAIKSDCVDGLVSLDPGVIPDVDTTWRFIHAVKQTRAEVLEFEDQMAKRMLAKKMVEREQLTAEFLNKLPVWEGPVVAGYGDRTN